MTEPEAQQGNRDLLPWWYQVDWQTDPRLAYGKGLHDGYELGHDAANREIVAALAQALGGPDCTDYREAVRHHHRATDAKARRDALDQAAGVDRGTGRRAA